MCLSVLSSLCPNVLTSFLQWLPLYRNGSLCSGVHSLPVMLEKPPANYSYITPHILLPGTKWVDNHKGIFNVVLEAASTLHPQVRLLDTKVR